MVFKVFVGEGKFMVKISLLPFSGCQSDISFLVCDILFRVNYGLVYSSYRAGSTDIPDPLSPLLPIVHRPR